MESMLHIDAQMPHNQSVYAHVDDTIIAEENRSKGTWDAYINQVDYLHLLDLELVGDDDYWEGFTQEMRRIALQHKMMTKRPHLQDSDIIF